MEQHEIENYIEEFKKKHLENIQTLMLNQGGLVPLIAVLCYDTDVNEPMVMMVPIMTEEFKEEDKQKVVSMIIPSLFKEMKERHKKPICFSFSSEAWLRKMDISHKPESEKKDVPENWRDLPKVEGLITTFETADYSELHCSTMNRIGKQINDDGELVDQILLEKFDTGQGSSSKVEGKFADIFKRYG